MDRLEIDFTGSNENAIVIDGRITDKPGPYTIKIFRSSSPDGNLNFSQPVVAQKVTILDDLGNFEILQNRGGGIFETDPNGIKGEVGRAYVLKVVLPNGETIESIADEMKPVGTIDSVYYTWEDIETLDGGLTRGFRVFIDSQNINEGAAYLRWRFTGAYMVESFPELNRAGNNCSVNPGPPDPPPCSGFIGRTNTERVVFIERVGDCSCCTCWVSDLEGKPNLSDKTIRTNGVFKGIEVGFVPFNQFTFGFNKYMVRVEQMSLTKEAFDFWNIIKDQKEGINSLFQPSFGKIGSNFVSNNTDTEVIGYFHASSVSESVQFLTSADAPIPVPPFDIVPPKTNCALWRPCNQIFPGSSTKPPPDWK